MKSSPMKIAAAVIIVIVLLGGAYLLFGKNKSSQTAPTSSTQSQSNSAPSSNIYMMKTGPKGTYLTDFQGMTLYIYDKDANGVSNCTGECLTNWPVYTSGATAQGTFPENITVITRDDGSKQFAWKGMPLYYFTGDKKAGDVTGDGLEGFSLAK